MKATILATLFLTAAAAAQTYNLQEIGQPCRADLRGQLVQTPQGNGIRFGVRTPLDNSLAVLVIGRRAPAPINLPGPTPCQLFVEPRATMLTMTNGRGNASFLVRIPPVLPIQLLFQSVVVDATPAGRLVASSDVIRLTGQ